VVFVTGAAHLACPSVIRRDAHPVILDHQT